MQHMPGLIVYLLKHTIFCSKKSIKKWWWCACGAAYPRPVYEVEYNEKRQETCTYSAQHASSQNKSVRNERRALRCTICNKRHTPQLLDAGGKMGLRGAHCTARTNRQSSVTLPHSTFTPVRVPSQRMHHRIRHHHHPLLLRLQLPCPHPT